MIFEFVNLRQEEKDMVFAFEAEHPEVVVREIKASLDGTTAVQLLTPEAITAAKELLLAIIGLITTISVATINRDGTTTVAKLNAEAAIAAAEINAKGARDAARISVEAETKNKATEITAANSNTEKAAYIVYSNGEKKRLPDGVSEEQLSQFLAAQESQK